MTDDTVYCTVAQSHVPCVMETETRKKRKKVATYNEEHNVGSGVEVCNTESTAPFKQNNQI